MTTIARATWTDDDGSGTTGTIINNARLQGDVYDKFDAALASLDGKNTSQDTAITNNANAVTALQAGVGVQAVNTNAAGQALTATTYTPLTFTGTDFVYGSMWAAGAPTRLTVPAGQAGVYFVLAAILATTGTPNLRLRFMKNGAVCACEMRATAIAAVLGINAFTMLSLAAGDYIEVQAFASVAASLGGTARDEATTFGMWKVG